MLKRIVIFLPIILFSACLEESSEKIDKKAFTKIYDNREFYSSFYALDMKQTSDGGFLILAGKTEVKREGGVSQNVNSPLETYILKTDALGNIVSELEITDPIDTYYYPVGKLNQVGDSFYFFCMDIGTNAFLVNVDELASISIVTPLSETLTLPLASSTDNTGGLLLLSYDNSSQESVISRISIAGTVTEPIRFYTGAESPIDNLVIRHANREGTQFPFAVGQTPSGTYFFNGFINYTFSLVFTSLDENEDIDGIVNGQQENAGFSTILPLSGTSSFAISTYNFGFNFLQPNASIQAGTTTSVTDIQETAYSFPELERNARVKAIRAVLNGKNVVLFASNTKSGQIGLYVYDEATGEFISSKYLGYSNPFEVGAVVQTPEGDLVVSGTTYIAGRLPRLCLIKVPKGEIKN